MIGIGEYMNFHDVLRCTVNAPDEHRKQTTSRKAQEEHHGANN